MTKFLASEAPEFAPESIWTSCDGAGIQVRIVGVTPWGKCEHWCDFDVNYAVGDAMFTKDIWNFQVRYMPLPLPSEGEMRKEMEE